MKKSALLLFAVFSTFLTSAQTNLSPVIEWQKSLGGSRNDKAFTIINTLDKGFLVVGESFSNDGNISMHHGSTDSSDAWVVKLNTNGDILWERSYGGTRNDRMVDAIALPDGDFIIVGRSESDTGDVHGLHKTNNIHHADLWVMRISASGNIRWSKLYGGTQPDEAVSIEKHPDGGYLVAGNTSSNDFDVTINHGASDIWLLRIDDNGAIIWQRNYGNTDPNFCSSITPISGNKFAISGFTTPPANLPPGCQVIYAEYSAISLMIRSSGFLLWQNIPPLACGNPGRSDFCSKLLELPSGKLAYLGTFYNASLQSFAGVAVGKVDTATGNVHDVSYDQLNSMIAVRDPGPRRSIILSDSSILQCASMMLYGESNFNGAITRWNTNNLQAQNFDFRKSIGGNNIESLNAITVLNDQSFAVAGYSNSNNGDVSGNHGGYDVWIVKLSTRNRVTGSVFIDQNNNGLKDAGEMPASGFKIESNKNGNLITTITDKNGLFVNMVDTGNYTTRILLQHPYYTVNPTVKQSNFTTYNQKDSFDFALTPVSGKKDLRISFLPLTPLRPGFEARYRIDYANMGTEAIQDAAIRMVKPGHTTLVTAIPQPASQIVDTILWNAGTIHPRDSGFIIVTLRSDPPPAINSGDRLEFITSVQPLSGDETPADNTDTVYQVVTGSLDPNDKIEKNDGIVYTEKLDAFQSFRYTIRFQNTGNDTAFTVLIRDTLSAALQGNSFELISASHPYTVSILQNKYITFTFDNILLVDSNMNEPLSHGFISYNIRPVQPLQFGDSIINSASIYFDFNPPVKTNIQSTVVKFQPPAIPIVSGLSTSYCDTASLQKGKISNLPPAGGQTVVTVKLDDQPLSIGSDSTFSFVIDTLSAGAHSIAITYANPSYNKTTTHNFTVIAALQPEVNLAASTTNITNMTTPVMITATNVVGGGTSPHYTFATDRNFTAQLAAGNSNQISLLPQVFTLGENWIYVKMRSNAACVFTESNTDSIRITRDLSTGITDPDNPSSVIRIYPNPVERELNISGLHSMKSYKVIISDLQGRIIQQVSVTNRIQAVIHLKTSHTGLMIVTIYDLTGNRKLGSVKLIGR